MAAHRYWRLLIDQNQGLGGNVSISEVEMHTAVGGADLCTGGTAAASGELSSTYSAAKAFDDNTATMWVTAFVVGAWISYDFGAGNAKDIVEVLLRSRSDGFSSEAPVRFRVQWSDDNASWTTSWCGTTDGTVWAIGQTRTFRVIDAAAASAAHRYWRLVIANNQAGSTGSSSICELELRSTVGGADQTVPGGAASASSVYTATFEATKAIDNDTITAGNKWSSNGEVAWWQYDFGTAKNVAQISVTAPNEAPYVGQAPKVFDLLYSDNGATWAVAASFSDLVWTLSETKTLIAAVPPSTVSSVTPSSGPTTGGTAVTITGSGFLSGASQMGRATLGAGAGAYSVTTVYADKFPLPAPGLAQSVSVHVKAFATARTCRLGIYADNGGAPGALLASTSTTPFASAPEGWLTINLSSPVSLASGTYWLAVQWSVATNCYITASGGSLVAEYAADLRNTFGSPPDLAFAPAGISIYATLSGVASATVGGVPLANFVVVNDTTITGVTGAHAAGVVDVAVGAATLPAAFTYLVPTAVTFDGLPATNVVSINANTLRCNTPAHAPGAVGVGATFPDGAIVTGPLAYTYVAPVALVALSPSTGSTVAGGTLTATATYGLTGATGATLGGVAVANFTVTSDTTATFTKPAHAEGTGDLVVTLAGGATVTLAGAFTWADTLSVSPPQGPTSAPTALTLSGNGWFGSDAAVTFGGAGINRTRLNASALQITAPLHTAGPVTIAVTSGGITKTATFTYVAPTVLVLPFPPDQKGFRVRPAASYAEIPLDGGGPRVRSDLLGAWARVAVQWTLGPDAFEQLCWFRDVELAEGALPFLADLYMRMGVLTRHQCYIVPETWEPIGTQNGRTFLAKAELVVAPGVHGG